MAMRIRDAASEKVLDLDEEGFLERLAAAGTPKEAWKAILEETIDELNAKHFVVPLVGRTVIASTRHDDALGRDHLVYSTPQDIKLLYLNRKIKIGTNRYREDILQDVGSVWLAAARRRTYQGGMQLIPKGPCPPDVFNLWRGWGAEPVEGDWPTIRAHLLTVICAGNEAHFDWLIGWLAYIVQFPEGPAEVAVVLRGLKGIGKGMLGQILMRIFRHHAVHISNGKHLVGHFNAHLADVLFLFVDEAFWAGDKAGEGVLKTLITEKTLMIEPKGVNAFPMPNRLKLVIATNEDWAVPASADERRYLMLDVANCKKGDLAYFDQLAAAIEGVELQAFLHALLIHDLTGWDRRAAPHTHALNEQKLLSASSYQRYWMDCVSSGALIATGNADDASPEATGINDDAWPKDVPVQALYAGYVDHARALGERYPLTLERFAKKLAELMPNGELISFRPRIKGKRPRHYKLGSLDDCRKAMLVAMNIDPDSHDWGPEE
jgi:hypothetical protein